MSRAECCQVLGVAPGATAAEIREAYLELAQVWHPDRFPDERLKRRAEDKLKDINEHFLPAGPYSELQCGKVGMHRRRGGDAHVHSFRVP